jgi:hypothetical protein
VPIRLNIALSAVAQTVVRLFRTNQFVVATCFDAAKVGTFHPAAGSTTVKIANADLVPTQANLRGGYASFRRTGGRVPELV